MAVNMESSSDNPWRTSIPASYRPGIVIRGTVTKVEERGIAVQLEPGLEGRLAASALPAPLAIGQTVEVAIVRVHPTAKQITLSLRWIGPF